MGCLALYARLLLLGNEHIEQSLVRHTEGLDGALVNGAILVMRNDRVGIARNDLAVLALDLKGLDRQLGSEGIVEYDIQNGVTALILSATKLVPYSYTEGFCLDAMLHPTAVSGDEGLSVMRSLLDVYAARGGMVLQFNIFDADTLRDAQKYPDKYRNLQVRVCGWNVLFNNMSRAEQDAYITRAEKSK